jgi:hypothetical protein
MMPDNEINNKNRDFFYNEMSIYIDINGNIYYDTEDETYNLYGFIVYKYMDKPLNYMCCKIKYDDNLNDVKFDIYMSENKYADRYAYYKCTSFNCKEYGRLYYSGFLNDCLKRDIISHDYVKNEIVKDFVGHINYHKKDFVLNYENDIYLNYLYCFKNYLVKVQEENSKKLKQKIKHKSLNLLNDVVNDYGWIYINKRVLSYTKNNKIINKINENINDIKYTDFIDVYVCKTFYGKNEIWDVKISLNSSAVYVNNRYVCVLSDYNLPLFDKVASKIIAISSEDICKDIDTLNEFYEDVYT